MRAVENAELLPALLAASPIGIAIASADAHLLQVNAALCTLLNATADALLGTDLCEHIHPENQPSCRAALTALVQAEIPQCDLTLRIRRQDGSVIWAQLTGVNDKVDQPFLEKSYALLKSTAKSVFFDKLFTSALKSAIPLDDKLTKSAGFVKPSLDCR